jgi:hypothetical protein
MLNKTLEIIVIIGLITMSASAASSSAYKCHIKSLKSLNDSGELVDFLHDEAFEFMKKEFVVDRDTGRMSGATTNHGPYGQPRVIDKGSGEQAYKALTIVEPFTTVDFLYVQEFAKGTKKPFFFVTGTKRYSGLCENY